MSLILSGQPSYFSTLTGRQTESLAASTAYYNHLTSSLLSHLSYLSLQFFTGEERDVPIIFMNFKPSGRAEVELAKAGVAAVWAEVSKLAVTSGSINLGQGFPDFPGHSTARKAAAEAILNAHHLNQYSPIPGLPSLLDACSAYYKHRWNHMYDPNTEVLITASGTEAIYSIMQALVEEGDEVILFEPYFPWYLPAVRLAGATPVVIRLEAPNFAIDAAAVASKLTDRTKVIIINTPHNPTGHCASYEELEALADVLRTRHAEKYRAGETSVGAPVVVSDEVYENIVFSGNQRGHVRFAGLPGMANRTLTVGSASKLFSLTGWRVGWVLGNDPGLMAAVRAMHAYSIYCAPAPLQAGVAAAFEAETDLLAVQSAAAAVVSSGANDSGNSNGKCFEGVPDLLERNNAALSAALIAFGVAVCPAEGGYFLVADVSGVTDMDDTAFCRWLIATVGVACMPMNVFYVDYSHGQESKKCQLVRFCLCKEASVIDAACAALAKASATELLARELEKEREPGTTTAQ